MKTLVKIALCLLLTGTPANADTDSEEASPGLLGAIYDQPDINTVITDARMADQYSVLACYATAAFSIYFQTEAYRTNGYELCAGQSLFIPPDQNPTRSYGQDTRNGMGPWTWLASPDDIEFHTPDCIGGDIIITECPNYGKSVAVFKRTSGAENGNRTELMIVFAGTSLVQLKSLDDKMHILSTDHGAWGFKQRKWQFPIPGFGGDHVISTADFMSNWAGISLTAANSFDKYVGIDYDPLGIYGMQVNGLAEHLRGRQIADEPGLGDWLSDIIDANPADKYVVTGQSAGGVLAQVYGLLLRSKLLREKNAGIRDVAPHVEIHSFNPVRVYKSSIDAQHVAKMVTQDCFGLTMNVLDNKKDKVAGATFKNYNLLPISVNGETDLGCDYNPVFEMSVLSGAEAHRLSSILPLIPHISLTRDQLPELYPHFREDDIFTIDAQKNGNVAGGSGYDKLFVWLDDDFSTTIKPTSSHSGRLESKNHNDTNSHIINYHGIEELIFFGSAAENHALDPTYGTANGLVVYGVRQIHDNNTGIVSIDGDRLQIKPNPSDESVDAFLARAYSTLASSGYRLSTGLTDNNGNPIISFSDVQKSGNGIIISDPRHYVVNFKVGNVDEVDELNIRDYSKTMFVSLSEVDISSPSDINMKSLPIPELQTLQGTGFVEDTAVLALSVGDPVTHLHNSKRLALAGAHNYMIDLGFIVIFADGEYLSEEKSARTNYLLADDMVFQYTFGDKTIVQYGIEFSDEGFSKKVYKLKSASFPVSQNDNQLASSDELYQTYEVVVIDPSSSRRVNTPNHGARNAGNRHDTTPEQTNVNR